MMNARFLARGLGRSRAALAVMSVGALTGCVTTADCDPTQANIFSVAACEGTGVAQDREDQRAQQAALAERRVQTLRNDVQRAQAEVAVRRQQRRSLEQRAIDVDRDVMRLRSMLRRAEEVDTVNRRELAALQARLDTLQASTSGGAAPSQRQIERSEAEAEAMFEEMDALIGVTS